MNLFPLLGPIMSFVDNPGAVSPWVKRGPIQFHLKKKTWCENRVIYNELKKNSKIPML